MYKESFFKIMERFVRMETEDGLFSLKVKGHNFWDYVRYNVFEIAIIRGLGEEKLASRQITLGSYFGFIWELFFYSVLYFKFLVKKRTYDLVFINGTDRKETLEGKKVNPYLYPLLKSLHRKYKVLVIDPYPIQNKSRHTPYPCDILYLRHFRLIDKIKSKLIKYSSEEKAIFLKIEEKIKRIFNLNYDISSLVNKCYSVELQNYRRYLKLFKRLSPKIVVYTNNGNMKSVVDAASSLCVLTVELQHAIVSFLNVLYSYPNDRGIFGILEKSTCPNYFFTFGDFWNSKCNLPSKKIAVGFPFFSYKKAMGLNGKKDPKKIIIFSDTYFSRVTLTKIALELSCYLPDYTILFKLRYEEYENWEENYPPEFKQENNIRIIDNDRKPLYEYLQECSYQIGINSTALCEGIGFNLTTFVIKIGFYEEMAPFYEGGHVFLVSDTQQIVGHIKQNITPKKMDVEQLFKGNAVQNIENTLRKILHAAGARQ